MAQGIVYWKINSYFLVSSKETVIDRTRENKTDQKEKKLLSFKWSHSISWNDKIMHCSSSSSSSGGGGGACVRACVCVCVWVCMCEYVSSPISQG